MSAIRIGSLVKISFDFIQKIEETEKYNFRVPTERENKLNKIMSLNHQTQVWYSLLNN